MQRRKQKICRLVLLNCVLLLVTGCVNTLSDSDREEISASENSESAGSLVSVTTQIQKLDKQFSAVRYEGDYGFERFLEQGGADSDQTVLQFLTSELSAEAEGLEINTDFFGCSTLSVENTEGGYLFGRNFDWQACDAYLIIHCGAEQQEGAWLRGLEVMELRLLEKLIIPNQA